MLTLTENQLEQLAHLEDEQFVAEVRRGIVEEYAELKEDDSLLGRLDAAHLHAQELGFTERPVLTQFLYTEAFAPGFYKQPAIDTWLRRPGQRVEERFADLLAVMKSKTRVEA